MLFLRMTYTKPKSNTDRAKRLFFNRNETKYLATQLLCDSKLSPSRCLTYNTLKLFAVRHNRLRCVLTGRHKSLVVKFQLSRIRLRDLITAGHFPGVRLASW